MEFFTHWMVTLAAAAFLGVCGIVIAVVQSIHGRHQKSRTASSVRP